MGKTYRRDSLYGKSRMKQEAVEFVDDASHPYGFKRVPMDPKSKAFRKHRAKFHSDSGFSQSVPHEYVNLNHERPMRRRTKQELKRYEVNPDHEVIIEKARKDAGYNYW